MKKTAIFLSLMTLILTGHSANASVKANNFNCHSPNDKYVFDITPETLTMIDEDIKESGAFRKLASSYNVKTTLVGNGIIKNTFIEGKQFIIGIKDQENPSDLSDYLIIRNKEGHEIMYPITCK